MSKSLCTWVAAIALIGGGFASADEKKPQPAPAEAVKKPGLPPEFTELRRIVDEAAKKGDNVDAIRKQLDVLEKALADKAKPAPDGTKPGKVAASRTSGRIVMVNAETKTISLARKGDGGIREDAYKVAADAVIRIDGKPGKLEALKPEMTVELTVAGEGKVATAVIVSGQKVTGVVKTLTADTLGFGGKGDQPAYTVKLAAGGMVIIKGKEAKLGDLQAGDKVLVVFTADESAAILISDGSSLGGDKPKPGVKPAPKPEK